MSRKLVVIPTLVLVIAANGCGLIERSSKATHTEDNAPSTDERVEVYEAPKTIAPRPESARPRNEKAQSTGGKSFDFNRATDAAEAASQPAPQQVAKNIGADAPNPKLKASNELFDHAKREQEDGAFAKAAELWKQFVDQNVGMPGYDRALYNYGFVLVSLGRAEEATEPLKSLIADTHDGIITNDARILLAESLIQTKKYEEALAITFEVLPDRAAEESAGLERAHDAVGVSPKIPAPNLAQKIRLFTTRGRIFASLGRQDEARAALEKAQILLIHAGKNQLSRKDMQYLSANYAWRQLEVQVLICQQSVKIPEKLSEAEFLAYAHAYYGCTAPAKQLYCTVLASQNEQVRVQAQRTYRQMVEGPLSIADHLPEPARKIEKPEQRKYYESEMKALIEKTVSERVREFKDLPSCHAHDVF